MKSVKYVKYLLVVGLIVTLVISSRSADKVASSGEDTAVEWMYTLIR